MKNVYSIKSYEGNRIIKKIIGQNEIMLLVGSAISQWPPTNIPSGRTFSEAILNILTKQINRRRKKFFNLIKDIPFEYLNEKCPNPRLLKKLFIKEFYPKKPNNVHVAIRNLVNKGVIHSVITTNYDTCLDYLIPNGSPLIHLIRKKDSQIINRNSRVLFKIHGSADPKNTRTMIFELSREGVLQEWKRRILKFILTGRCLLVMGYSGLDFEICPELMQIPLGSFLWNCYKDPKRYKSELSEYPKRLMDRHNGLILWGDLRDFLNGMGEKIRKTKKHINEEDFRQKICSSFSKKEIIEWACSIFSQPGYANQILEVAEKFYYTCQPNTTDYGKYHSFMAESYFSMGKYKKAAKRANEASKIFITHNNDDLFITSELRKIDSLRCWGKIRDAKSELKSLHTTLNSNNTLLRKYQSNAQLQEVLILREEYERSRILNLNKIAESKKKKMRHLLRKIVKKAEKGKWYDLQQCRLWANRVGISFDEIYKGSLIPLDDWFGYRKLGHIIAEMMSARDSLWRGGVKIEASQILKYIRISKIISSASEQWKLKLAFKKHFINQNIFKTIHWIRPFLNCEYTLLMRFFKLISEKYR